MKDYYKNYLTLHQNKNCIRLHFLGQWITIICSFYILINWLWYLIPIIPFIIYPFAWTGHFLFEKNKPAAFHNPIKAKISDWFMFWDILKGKIKIW
jgi:hypothetical protein|tara:strand:+ start:516 stop:803 length:288 start_codon:yes stop_codon:yes gene_type:complete